MPKLRVYQLARELNRDNAEIIRELQHMGVPVTSHSNTVEDRLADKLRRELGVFSPKAGAKAASGDDIIAVDEGLEVEPPHEQRKTMQQIVQEKLRQEHRLPPAPPPGAPRRPFDRPGQRPMAPGTAGQPRHPSAPGFQNRSAAPGAPAGQRPWTRPGGPAAPSAPRPRQHDRADRPQRYERQGQKKLDSPFGRPQSK